MPGATTLMVFSLENTKASFIGQGYNNLHFMSIFNVESKFKSKL